MKPKSTLMLILLALAGLVDPQEQARAAVGYVNAVLLPGYNLIANPLYSGNNSVTNVITPFGEIMRVYPWNVTTQAFGTPATFDPGLNEWDGNFDLPPGKGCMVEVISKHTNTFTGEIRPGHFTNFVAGGNNLSLLGSKVPLSGGLSSQLSYPATNGDNVFFFYNGNQTYSNAYTFFEGFGWFNPNTPSVSEPVLTPGQALFIQNAGSGKDWVQILDFFASQQSTSLSDSRQVSAGIRNLRIRAGKVTLEIANPKGRPYDVQFSADGLNWKTVAKGQAAAVWTGPYSGGVQGYYQLTQP